jgi:hypothetical protein
MTQLTIEEARGRLDALVDAAIKGENVVLVCRAASLGIFTSWHRPGNRTTAKTRNFALQSQ